jgi:hypothetical protein
LVHSHKRLGELFDEFNVLISQSENNEWIVDVIKLVAFHQSFPNTVGFMNFPLLDEGLVKLFFDYRLIDMMKIIMVNDSASHSKFTGESFTEEIIENLNILRQLF